MAIPRNLGNFANTLNTDGQAPRIQVGDSSVVITDTGSNGTIAFTTDNSERGRFTSAGLFLVNQTTDQAGCLVDASRTTDALFSASRFVATTGSASFYFNKSRGASVGTNTIVQADDSLGVVYWRGANGTGYTEGAYIAGQVDGTPGASNDMPGRLVFATTADGSGSPTERMRISANGTIKTSSTISVGGATPTTSGAGITFPATQSASTDANTLDDYEEGTFTLSNGGNTTYTSRSGRYTKIGNFVKCSFFHNINVLGTGSATTLSGLPFTPSSTAPTINGGVVTYISGLAVSALAIGVYADNAAQIIFMTRNASDTNATTQLPAVMGNSFAVYAEVSYLID